MNIATLSGGIMSFYSAYLAIQKYGKENVLLYFNDTKWEHPDLYRFLDDIKCYLDKDILYDSDGRNPEQVFLDEKFLGNNRVPICSRILKAERLQEYYAFGDNLIFGLGVAEIHRARRIVGMYQVISAKNMKYCTIEFPLINNKVQRHDLDKWFECTRIKSPKLYKLGFEHNNCSGGCVRQGKRQWLHLLKTLPEIYQKREEFEQYFRKKFKGYHYLKDITLKELRETIELQKDFNFEDSDLPSECIGVCGRDAT